jgi:hypothetical protein
VIAQKRVIVTPPPPPECVFCGSAERPRHLFVGLDFKGRQARAMVCDDGRECAAAVANRPHIAQDWRKHGR